MISSIGNVTPGLNPMFHTLKRCFTPQLPIPRRSSFAHFKPTRLLRSDLPKTPVEWALQSVPGRQPGNIFSHIAHSTKMISDEVNSLPSKSRSLRAKSIAKRLATEKNQIESNNNTTKPRIKRSSNSSKHHTMSKYRRKVANAKERERMKLVSEAFDRLSNVVPVYKMMTANNSNVPQDEIIPNAQVCNLLSLVY